MGNLKGAKSYLRGHQVISDGLRWRYIDTGEVVNKETDNGRPCKRCGKLPTPDGHDACLGKLPGVIGACCGHGISEPIMIKG